MERGPLALVPRPSAVDAVPKALRLAGISLDALVQSDREKIRSTVKAVMKAVERDDIAALGRCLAEDYRDSFHHSKIQLLQHAEEGLERSSLVKAKIAGLSSSSNKKSADFPFCKLPTCFDIPMA